MVKNVLAQTPTARTRADPPSRGAGKSSLYSRAENLSGVHVIREAPLLLWTARVKPSSDLRKQSGPQRAEQAASSPNNAQMGLFNPVYISVA